MTTAQVNVLIVGAGPVGLALAGDLGWRGVSCLAVEQTDGSVIHPKMDSVSCRTMEFCRRWGIVDQVQSSPYPRDYAQDIVYMTSLTGYELAREKKSSMAKRRIPEATPYFNERCPQDMFDPILQRFATSQPGVAVRYKTKLIGYTEEVDGVRAELEDVASGKREFVYARYLAACDGAGSSVRRQAGIKMIGQGVLTHTTNVIFRCANLLEIHGRGQAYRYVFVGEHGVWATIVAINGADRWRLSIVGSSNQQELSESDINAVIARAAGVEFDYEILTVSPWVRRELIAESYGKGRIFLVGDSAHSMSPTGGLGMNTGIQEAVDLSWKLQGVIEGWAHEDLLTTYEIERQPVAARNIAEATVNLKNMLSIRKADGIFDQSPHGDAVRNEVGLTLRDRMHKEWNQLGLSLGYRYDGSPICWWEGSTPLPAWPFGSYDPIIRPGVRAPHVWMTDGRSTLDLFGRQFVLLRIGVDAPDVKELVNAAERRAVPLQVVSLTDPAVEKVYDRKLVLVRPDGHIAWCADAMHSYPIAIVDCIRGDVPELHAADKNSRTLLIA